MKGIELPLNTIIIMAIAVIVLLATASFFFRLWQGPRIEAQEAMNTCCLKLTNQDPYCTTALTAITGCSSNTNFDTLAKACAFLGKTDTCKSDCGCITTTTTTLPAGP